ncbi:hypothetical protein A5821_000149 [Enterococcus sp. 7F3_DIV0205]|uniref:Lipoprotein n=1 Tax=Candidatus Enterococcus palustris TaxID=1834189 RepID=A0AAQ3W6E5_9ENTE|nr:hypothetical protein [Enterococcus sp. 7F3_DIV0205]OTN84555.1 hypothetical protein A5821_000483 [Enterococcus sp. 7F3_DIV0205]
MKKKAFLFTLTILLGLSIISACSSKKQATKVEHQKLTWHEAREKPFGTFDYPKITEKEALTTLENKFKVRVPSLIEQTKEMLKNDVSIQGMVEGAPEYTMYASGDELKVRGYYPLNEGPELKVFALIDLKYTFDKEKKEVRLATQSLAMTTYGDKSTYPKDNFDELLAKSAEIIDLPKKLTARSIQNFNEDYKELDKRPTSSKAVVYSNDKEAVEKKKVSQALLGGFDNKQELKEIYATIVDYTE